MFKFLVCILKNPFRSKEVVGLFQNLLVIGNYPLFGTNPKDISSRTWNIVRNLKIQLVSGGEIPNIFFSLVVYLREFRSLLFNINIKNRMFMSEVSVDLIYLFCEEGIWSVLRRLRVVMWMTLLWYVVSHNIYYRFKLWVTIIILGFQQLLNLPHIINKMHRNNIHYPLRLYYYLIYVVSITCNKAISKDCSCWKKLSQARTLNGRNLSSQRTSYLYEALGEYCIYSKTTQSLSERKKGRNPSLNLIGSCNWKKGISNPKRKSFRTCQWLFINIGFNR